MIEQRQVLPAHDGSRAPERSRSPVVRMDGHRTGPVDAEPGGPAARTVAAEHRFLRRCVGYLAADLGIRQYVDFGSRLPPAQGVAGLAPEYRDDARVVRVATGTAVPLHAGASSPFPTVWLERPRAEDLVARLGLCGRLDLGEPVAVLLDTDLLGHHPAVRDVVDALHAALVPGSHLVVRQRPANPDDPYARELAAALFDPFHLLEPGVADLAWWPYPDEEVAATGVGVLAGVARRR